MAKRELLFSVTREDFKIETFRSGGKGGQNQNTRNTGCRIRHPDSGAVAESREHRTFGENRKAAFLRLTKTVKFKVWYSGIVHHLQGHPSIEEIVEKAMAPEKIKVEVKDENGRWVEE